MQPKIFFIVYLIGILSLGFGFVLINEVTAEEKLVFLDFEFSEEDYINFHFKNVGNREVIVDEVEIDYKPFYQLENYGGAPIPVGHTIGLTCPIKWETGKLYYITLVTNTGKYFTEVKEAPQRFIPLIVEETSWNSTDDTISLVIGNIDKRTQNITGFGIAEFPYDI